MNIVLQLENENGKHKLSWNLHVCTCVWAYTGVEHSGHACTCIIIVYVQ